MHDPLPTDPLGLHAAVDALGRGGLDLVRAFDARLYNEAVAAHAALRPLSLFGRDHALGLVVGNTRRLWPLFLRAYAARAELRGADDPLDRYVQGVVEGAARALHADARVHLAPVGGEARVSMLHAADVSGLAPRGPAHLAVHPEHGPWIGLRAVVVVDAPPPTPAEPTPSSPCVGCEAPCVPALERALERAGAASVGRGEIAASWRSWVAVRDACPVGRASRYDEAQLRYHYTKDRSALGGAEGAAEEGA